MQVSNDTEEGLSQRGTCEERVTSGDVEARDEFERRIQFASLHKSLGMLHSSNFVVYLPRNNGRCERHSDGSILIGPTFVNAISTTTSAHISEVVSSQINTGAELFGGATLPPPLPPPVEPPFPIPSSGLRHDATCDLSSEQSARCVHRL